MDLPFTSINEISRFAIGEKRREIARFLAWFAIIVFVGLLVKLGEGQEYPYCSYAVEDDRIGRHLVGGLNPLLPFLQQHECREHDNEEAGKDARVLQGQYKPFRNQNDE